MRAPLINSAKASGRANLEPHPGPVTAVLGPTNTGKTHLAVERMLGHRSGVIGLPLRLLAREIYDRVVATKGPHAAALITGEEKIVPDRAVYFVCTTESMPTARTTEFLAVDEVQLATDPERGHVFTDRLLHSRGLQETMFLGADTIRPLIRKLVPEASFETRPRLSRLSYTGHSKLSRIGRRSAIVAFSAEDVYAIAEMVRRHRGGTAVVLGALSPRTRNAQVDMFENGEVDYLVATDAIGMGLNLNVDHVAFAALRKFDGVTPRQLTPQETAQIAGRAGRHLSDGTFGTTSSCSEIDPETIERVENHRFENDRIVFWRNPDLDFSSASALLTSLEKPPPQNWRQFLMRPRRALDRDAFASLHETLNVRNPEQVRMLWAVCQVPDYRKTLTESHSRLLSSIYGFLSSGEGTLAVDWLADRVARLDRSDGDIDTLATRIAHIRTWTYVCHHANWVADAEHWKARTREVEDRLSDALHNRLTQRFVDRRSAALSRRLSELDELNCVIGPDGEVSVDGHAIGRLAGFRFVPDRTDTGAGQRLLRTTAHRTLRNQMRARAGRMVVEPDSAFSLTERVEIAWRGEPVARLARDAAATHPRLIVIASDILDGAVRKQIEARLGTWLADHLSRKLAPLRQLERPELSAAARGLVFQVVEGLGAVARTAVADQIAALTPTDRKELAKRGLRLGAHAIYLPAMSRRPRPTLCAQLWALFHNIRTLPELPSRGISPAADLGQPEALYLAAGALVLGGRAVCLDHAERLTTTLYRRANKGPVAGTPDLYALAGCTGKDFAAVAMALGFAQTDEPPGSFVPARKARLKRQATHSERPRPQHSAFAALARHPLGNTGA